MTQLNGFKFVTTLVLLFRNVESEDKTKYDTLYSNSKAKIIFNKRNIDDVFPSSNIQTSLGKDPGRITDSVLCHSIIISKYGHSAGSSYINLLKELDQPRNGLFNTQNVDDNQCFKCSIFRYLNALNRHSARIRKADKNFAKKIDF